MSVAGTAAADEPIHILIVDDDALFVESLERNLVSSGYRVTQFGEGEEALEFLGRSRGVDLVLLDWKMPGMNGIEVLRRLRADWPDLPVIFLTVLGEQIYEEAALVGGAVDYVEKSRSYSILRKRIELVFEHRPEANGAAAHGHAPDDRLESGPLVLDLESSRAYWHDAVVELTLTEFKLVHCLVSQAGRDIPYRELYNMVRRDGFVAGYGEEGYRTNVRSFIKRIRQKFREIDPAFDRIENYPAFGYRWRADNRDAS